MTRRAVPSAVLSRDVAREAVGDHHVDRARGDVVALHEAVILHGQPALAQDGVGGADLLVPLHLLRADVEQAHRRLDEAQHRAGEELPHDGELDQVGGVAHHIGAEVEHHALALEGWKERRDGRPVDPGQGLERDLGHGHQRARVAGRDHTGRRAVAHRVDGQAHARSAAAAQSHGEARLAGDDLIGVMDGYAAPQAATAAQLPPDPGLVAKDQELDVGIALAGDMGALDDDLRRIIAAHGIERDGQGLGHGISPLSRPRSWRLSAPGLDDLTVAVIAARIANMVRALELATIGAFRVGGRGQGVVGTPHVAPGLGDFSLRYGHSLYLSLGALSLVGRSISRWALYLSLGALSLVGRSVSSAST